MKTFRAYLSESVISDVNKEAKTLGYKLVRGEGYYYFVPISDEYPMLRSSSVYVYRADQLSKEQWLDELHEFIKNDKN